LESRLQPAKAGTPAGSEDIAFFEKKVRPLLVNRCQECHSSRTKKKRGGLLLDNRASILAGGDTGPAVVPGQPAKSLIVQAVRHEHETLAMPPKGKLPAAEIAILEEWVRRGAIFPGPTIAPRTKAEIDLAAGKKFWSFQPLKQYPLPPVRISAWMQRRSDAFLLAGMEQHGLSPAPPADRRTLIRRVTFDLVGLPPTPNEVDAFVADNRPDAYPRLVDRLLASPRHGERWGRYWLDLARYCDVAEPWSESKGAPWLYRDWVVCALNGDRGYDRVIQMQLAADLLPDTDRTDRAALGFIGLSPTYWKELKLDHNVIKGVVAEEWEERIHTLGSTFLGLTVACARCHDHKFDPITTQDYYALAGVFASIRQSDLSLLPDEQARQAQQAREKLRGVEAQLSQLRKNKKPDDKVNKEIAKLTGEARMLRSTPHLNEPLVPGVTESSLHVLTDGPHHTRLVYKPQPEDVAVQVRGNPASVGPVVPRRFLAVLSGDAPRPFRQGSGRLELAQAIVGEAGALAARVIVNRVWEHHFGAGLVRTPSDFGRQGERPSHPELLDDLAARFVANGWSLKWLHREIVLSAAYQQSSRTSDQARVAPDPDNRWLSRMSRRRLEVEAWRDAVLSATGLLDPQMGGPAIDLERADNHRRTLYGIVKRRELNNLLRLNDFPDPTTHSASRIPTTTPLQQLFVLNSPFMQRQSAALVRRLHVLGSSDRERIRTAYWLLYGRPATEREEELGLAFLAEAGRKNPSPQPPPRSGEGEKAKNPSPQPPPRSGEGEKAKNPSPQPPPRSGEGEKGWEQYAQVLLASNEFLYVD
jgi:hypothetical protein